MTASHLPGDVERQQTTWTLFSSVFIAFIFPPHCQGNKSKEYHTKERVCPPNEKKGIISKL